MNDRKQLLTVDNQELEYRLLNSKEQPGPTLVFLHEGLGCVDLWKGFPSELCTATGLPGLVYSRMGYGASSPATKPRQVNFMHDEACNILGPVLDHTGIQNAILVGHSDGASIAVIYAGAAEDRRLSGLILLAPHLFVEPETIKGIASARHNYLEGKLRRQLERYHGENVDSAFWGWNDIWLLPEFLAWNIQEYVPGIKVPTLAIQGVDDEYGTTAQIEALESGLTAQFEQYLIADCGHSPHLERRDLTLTVITQFIGQKIFPCSNNTE